MAIYEINQYWRDYPYDEDEDLYGDGETPEPDCGGEFFGYLEAESLEEARRKAAWHYRHPSVDAWNESLSLINAPYYMWVEVREVIGATATPFYGNEYTDEECFWIDRPTKV